MATQLYTHNTKKPVTGHTADGYNALHVTEVANLATFDVFGRKRVSNPKVLFSVTHSTNNQDHTIDTLTVGAGVATFLQDEAAFKFELGTASGDRVVRQSYEYITYTPGNSHTALFTGVLGAGSSASSQRIGLFDDDNGVFIEQKNQELGVVIRSNVSGSVVNTRIEQKDFNIDDLYGPGDSKLNIDTTKTQIFHISYEWLGVGSVVFSVVHNGVLTPFHVEHHSNLGNIVYMQTGSLPIRYESVNTGITTATDDFRMICSMVMSEGDVVLTGHVHGISNGTAIEVVGTTLTPILSLKVNPINPRILIELLNAEIFSTGKDSIQWALIFGHTLTGASWIDVHDGISQYDTSATAYTGGSQITTGYAFDKTVLPIIAEKLIRKLAYDIGGTTPIIATLAARAFTGTADVVGAITYREII